MVIFIADRFLSDNRPDSFKPKSLFVFYPILRIKNMLFFIQVEFLFLFSNSLCNVFSGNKKFW